MNPDHVKERLHGALHRGRTKVSEEELAEVAALVLVIVGEMAAEIAEVVGELASRVAALEAAKG